MNHRILNIATLNIAVKAARRASQIINRASMNIPHLEVANKQVHDYVTEVDREAEAAIIRILTESCPDFGILAEESGEHNTGKSEFRWIIDPLDGTTNFIHGFPQYAVSIALAKGNQIELGVVFDPTRNELFTAARGQGAYLNDKRIRVSSRIRLDEALLGTGFPFRDFTHMDSYLAILRELAEKTSGLRRPGAASLDLAYVAAGRLDGFWEFGLAPWDMAAGSILITEAGGLVCDFSGEANYLTDGNVVAGTPRIFHSLLQIVQNHRPKTLQA
ncbi:MAG: inositol monophosphatase [Betaproteobacteria bacterium]|nr:inositol monophosphatase [Betaproteobacteria bacterium]